MTALFISHSSQDAEITLRIGNRLRDAGFAALFMDFDPVGGIPAGRVWERELYAQLRRSDGVVFLASPASTASRWCGIELGLARSLDRPIFPVRVAGTDTDPLLADLQWVDVTVDEDGAFAQLCAGLEAAGLRGSDSFTWDSSRPPYPGLSPFDAQDAAVFFGREAEVARLLELFALTLQRESGRFVTLVGPSGSGKSSLVRAGLLPRLRRQSGRWVVAPPMLPGDRPTASLARSLAGAFAGRHGGLNRLSIERQLLAGPSQLVEVVRDLGDAEGGVQRRVLVVIDQAEELVTRCSAAERTRFVNLVRGAMGPDSLLWVVATLRSESLGRFVAEDGMAALVEEPMVIGPLSRSRLWDVVVRPAQRGGLEFAPGLVERIVDDTVGGDALPLLAYTLQQLAQRAESGRPITGDDYDGVGGVVGALTRQANRISAELARQGKGQFVLSTLLQLAAVDGDGEPTRRRVPLKLLSDEQRAVVEAFVDARLLTSGGQHEGATVEVAHEALLRQWPPLRAAIEAARHGLELRGDIERLGREWDQAGRDDSYLLRGVRLAQVEELGGDRLDEIGPVGRAFIAASRRHAAAEIERTRQSNRRLRRLVALLAIVAFTAVVAFVYALQQAQVAQREALVARSRQLASIATNLFGQRSDVGMLVALEGVRTAPTTEALGAVAAGLGRAHRSLIATLPTGPVPVVALSPSGAILAAGASGGTVQLWDLATRQPLGEPFGGHPGAVVEVAFSPDGTTLASADTDGMVRLWDPITQKPLGAALEGQRGRVWAVAFSPDGRTLASAADGTVQVWDLATRQPVGEPLRGHNGPVWAVAFSPDGTTLASAGRDQTVRLWDPATHLQLGDPLDRHSGGVWAVAFSPDGTTLASAGNDGTVRLWDPTTHQPRGDPLIDARGTVWAVAFSPDGTTLASANGGSLRIWDLATRQPLGEPLMGARTVAFSPDGATLASAGHDGTVRLWDAALRQYFGEPLDDSRGPVAFSPDGTTLAVARGGTVWLWDPARRQPVGDPLDGHDGAVKAIAFSPDGATLASADSDGTVRLWDVTTRRLVYEPLRGHTDIAGSVRFSPDGATLASASDDGTVRLWNVATGQLVGKPLYGHTDRVKTVTFSPDGTTLASAGGDHTVRLWDVASRQLVDVPLIGHADWVRAVAFSPDGTVLASASDDGTVRLWHPQTRRQVGQPLSVDDTRLLSVGFSPDGAILASGGSDGAVRLWDVAGRQLLVPLSGHADWVQSVAFSPDGTVLASAGDDGTVRLWPTPAGWDEAVCAVVGRNLSADEWDAHIGSSTPYVRTCQDLPSGVGAPVQAPTATYPRPL